MKVNKIFKKNYFLNNVGFLMKGKLASILIPLRLCTNVVKYTLKLEKLIPFCDAAIAKSTVV
jgi:hypothetical protein